MGGELAEDDSLLHRVQIIHQSQIVHIGCAWASIAGPHIAALNVVAKLAGAKWPAWSGWREADGDYAGLPRACL